MAIVDIDLIPIGVAQVVNFTKNFWQYSEYANPFIKPQEWNSSGYTICNKYSITKNADNTVTMTNNAEGYASNGYLATFVCTKPFNTTKYSKVTFVLDLNLASGTTTKFAITNALVSGYDTTYQLDVKGAFSGEKTISVDISAMSDDGYITICNYNDGRNNTITVKNIIFE